MTELASVVFLLDVNNTLLDNDRVATVFPRQGHYASDPKALVTYPPADMTIERIGNLLRYDLPALLRSDRAGSTRTTSKSTLGEKR